MGATDHVVLVHGLWHGSWCWTEVAQRLTAEGLTVTLVDLPGRGRADGGEDLASQAAHVRAVVDALPAPALVCCHSYGGTVVTEALQSTSPVTRLVYLTAFALDVGESTLGRNQPEDPTDAAPPDFTVEGDYILPSPVYAADGLYNDLDPERAQDAAGRLVFEPMAAITTEVTQTAWRGLPSSYVICARDRAIAPSVQRVMAGRAADTVYELDCGHLAMLARPGEVASILVAEARRVSGLETPSASDAGTANRE